MAKTKDLSYKSIGAKKTYMSTGEVWYDQNESSTVGFQYHVAGTLYGDFTHVTGRVFNTQGISATATVIALHILVSATNYSGGGYTIYAGAMSSSPVTTNYSAVFNEISSVPASWMLTTGTSTKITVTDPATINKILSFGIGFRPQTSSSWPRTETISVSATYEYEDPYEAPEIHSISSPSSAYINDPIKLSWSYSQAANVMQYAIDVQVTDAAGKSHTILNQYITELHSCTVSLDSLELSPGDAVFRVRAYIQSGTVVGEWASSPPVTLENVKLSIVHPKGGENKLAAEPMRMQWKKATDDTSVNDPYAFTVQYSENAGESWENLLEKETANKENGVWYVDVPADMFRHGIVQWRVMPWTTQYVYGEYAKDSFFAVVQASTESVSCDGKPIPTVSWSSESQIAYQVRFADYDSGAVYSGNTSHRVPYVYPNGLYAVQVRTQATTGAWSDWTEPQYIQVTNVAPTGSIAAETEVLRHSVKISWTVYGTFAGYILYRNEIPVYVGTDLSYNDIGANGKTVYKIRAITSNSHYVESAEITVNATPKTDCVYDFTENKWIPLKYSVSQREREYTTSQKVTYKHYAGRKKPIVFTEQFTERAGEFAYAFRTHTEAEQVNALAGQVVLYKGKDESVIYGVINNIIDTSGMLRRITFTITEIDREERVPYGIT